MDALAIERVLTRSGKISALSIMRLLGVGFNTARIVLNRLIAGGMIGERRLDKAVSVTPAQARVIAERFIEFLRRRKKRGEKKAHYIMVYVGKNHPLARGNGVCSRHRLAWYKAGLPMPGPGQVLHHKDGNSQNDVVDNLQLLTTREHSALHRHNNAEDLEALLASLST